MNVLILMECIGAMRLRFLAAISGATHEPD